MGNRFGDARCFSSTALEWFFASVAVRRSLISSNRKLFDVIDVVKAFPSFICLLKFCTIVFFSTTAFNFVYNSSSRLAMLTECKQTMSQ